MGRLKYIQDINDAEIKLVKAQSEILLQKKADGLNGELKTSGTIIENYIKGILQKHIPKGYRICSGYIATNTSINDAENLIQHDIIIVDDSTPALYQFGISDIEIVAAESVCAIFEIKRTLTKKSIKSAIEHLKRTKDILDEYENGIKSKRKASVRAVASNFNAATRCPLYGIIGLNCTKESVTKDFIESDLHKYFTNFVDIIWAPSSNFLIRFAIWENEDKSFVPQNVSRQHKDYDQSYVVHYFNDDHGYSYRLAISLLRSWIKNTTGSGLDINNTNKYFGL